MGKIDGRKGGFLGGDLPRESYDVPDGFLVRRWQDEAGAEFRKKARLAKGAYFTFTLTAGVGSGKTLWSAMQAAWLLNRGAVERIVFVCPNRLIRSRVVEEFARLGIELRVWNNALRRKGEPDHCRGVVMTYHALMRDHAIQAASCATFKTLVIFDEIHHLGDDLAWCETSRKGFEGIAACVLAMSGTPFRGDNREIPFVGYEPELDGIRAYKADYNYPLGRAIRDGVCKMPVFHWLDGHVNVRMPDGTKRVIDFSEDCPVAVQNRRLNGAVLPGCVSRNKALDTAIEYCRRAGRKLIIYVGGDTTRKDSGGVRDATEFLPAELAALGIQSHEYCTVVAEDSLAHEKIRDFGRSRAWILIAVNLVSEGVDIPELSAELFLTSITARATTIQRLGRALRGQGEAHIFMFADPRYKRIATDILDAARYEIDLGKPAPAPTPPAPIVPGRAADAEPTAIGLDCREEGITVGDRYYPATVRLKYYRVLRDYDFPEGNAFMSVLLPLILEGKFGPIEETAAIGGEV